MTLFFNKKENKGKRRFLRKNMTKAEIYLWTKLKAHQINGLKFRRQYGIKNYVADFYCPEIQVAIEVDGGVHGYDAQIAHDEKRQEEIEALGIKVLRYTNKEVIQNIEGVLRDIVNVCSLRRKG